ncbi:MAG: GAF domain-containing sensor histidine kinase, partial [Chloroflexota bacterium]
NLGLSIISLWNWRLPYHAEVITGIDFLLAPLLFHFSGGLLGPLSWVILLPTISAGRYFGLKEGMIVAGVTVGWQSIYGLATVPILDAVIALLPAVSVALVVGSLVGYLSDQFGSPSKEDEVIVTGLGKMGKEVEEHRLQAVYRIMSTLNSTLNYERLLDLALDLSIEVLTDPDEEESRLVSAFLLFDGRQMRVGSARGFIGADMRATLPGNAGIVGQAINERTMTVCDDPVHDEELSGLVTMHALSTALCYPLRSGLDVYGLLLFGHPEPGFFDESRQEILDVIGRQAQSSIVNAKLYKDLEEEKIRMTEIQEEARKQLARNLHDGPTQSVAAIAMRVNFARRLIEKDMAGASEELYKIENLARRTTKEIRHMLFTLRPLVLESSGLKAALQSMADKMKETFEQNVIVDVAPEAVEQLEMGKQGVIFYIAEEAVNNARKHAEAQHIVVRIKPSTEDIVLLEILDDGVGFSIGAVDTGYENRGSLGMVNMRERTELINGVLDLDSEVGRGTRVRVWIPLNEDAAERIRHAN